MDYLDVKRQIKFLFVRNTLRRKKFLLEDSIIISSDPRSGSTWIMELFGSLPGCVVNWEPLHPGNGVVPSDIELGARVLLTDEDDVPRFRRFFEDILTYKIFTPWSAQYISLTNIRNSKFVVTKFVRANNLLPWFHDNLNLRYKPILLMRHPITTCISQLKNFHQATGASLTDPCAEDDKYIVPNCLNNERFVLHEEYINTLNTTLERQIALWCINNTALLDFPDGEKWITVYYENLVRNPEGELAKLISELKLPFKREDYKNLDFDRVSKSTSKAKYNSDPSAKLESFLKKLDEDYLLRIQTIFDYFGLKRYSAFNAYPVH